jgi:hypothetical protein
LRSKYIDELALRPAASLAVSRTAKEMLQMIRPINSFLLKLFAISLLITVALAVLCSPVRMVRITIKIVNIVTFFFIKVLLSNLVNIVEESIATYIVCIPKAVR